MLCKQTGYNKQNYLINIAQFGLNYFKYGLHLQFKTLTKNIAQFARYILLQPLSIHISSII